MLLKKTPCLLVLLLTTSLTLRPMVSGLPLLEKQQFANQNMRIGGYGSVGQNEFQINFEPNATSMATRAPKFVCGFAAGIPALGYYGDGYPQMSRIAYIKLPYNLLINTIPQQIVAEINTCKCTKIEGQILIHNTFERKPANILFHPFLGVALGKQADFQANVPMGIFNANGVTNKGISSDISFNNFRAENVNVHDGTKSLSPNNARFDFEKNRSIATFWSAAYINTYMTISLHLVFDSTKQPVITHLITNSDTTAVLLQKLYQYAITLPVPDARALREFCQNMIQIFLPIPLEHALFKLKLELTTLAHAIEQI